MGAAVPSAVLPDGFVLQVGNDVLFRLLYAEYGVTIARHFPALD